jgi:sensor histidine kinase YesM
MFFSPLTYMRGNGMSFLHYLMTCMSPLLMMIVFYVNYFWLTPRCFVVGKRRYYLLYNTIMVIAFGIILHPWVNYTNDLFMSHLPRYKETNIDTFFFTVRDMLSLAMSAAVATAIVLATRWQHNEDARLAAENARVDAEIKNLRFQINPHFLLNTLNNIYALTAFDQKRAQDAIQQLSKMLRHMLYDNQQEAVTLGDEIQFLENYVNLMKIRLPQNVSVEFTKKVRNMDLRVAPLMFISLVENAFKHGISTTEPSFVNLSIETDIERVGDSDVRDFLIFRITNSNFPKTQEDRSGHGIGLQQVQRRLDLAYPNRYEWAHAISDDGKVYSSTIKIKL